MATLILHKDGRVDLINPNSVSREVTSKTDIISMQVYYRGNNVYLAAFVRADGSFGYNAYNGSYVRDNGSFENNYILFIGEPSDYGKIISAKVPDENTKRTLKKWIESQVQYLKNDMNKYPGFKNRHKRREIQDKIDRLLSQLEIINEI